MFTSGKHLSKKIRSSNNETSIRMGDLSRSAELLESTIASLENAVGNLKDQTKDINNFNEILESKLLFDVLPERLVLHKPLKIRKMVKPMIEKDSAKLGEILDRLKKRKLHLQQQSKILELKLETISS